VAARAGRPRKTDCDPSTDFNLCACEREYSIEAARHPEPVIDVPATAGGVKGKRPVGRRCATLDPVLVARALQLRDAAHRDGNDLRLTDGPLHTRPRGSKSEASPVLRGRAAADGCCCLVPTRR
jgi:hypothetical protein